jgi:hypothetical protein
VVDNWADFSRLVVDAYVPGTEPLRLTVAVGHVGTPGTSA